LKALDTQYSNLGQKPAGGQMFRAEIEWRKLHLNQIDKCSLEWKKGSNKHKKMRIGRQNSVINSGFLTGSQISR